MTTAPLSLVTGAAGFLGSHVADDLVRAGHRVIGLDDLSGGTTANVSPDVELVVGDITDDEVVDRLIVGRRVEHVFHLAAYAAEGLSHFIRRFNYTNNLVGSATVLNAAVRAGSVRRFVFTSSIAVYGSAPPPMRESDIPRPEDPYGIAKYATELDLAAAHELFGLDFTVFRPHNVYGERQNLADPYRNVVGIFMNRAMQGRPFPVFGDGEQRRAFSHVSDVAPLIARSVDLDATVGRVLNVGGDVPCTVNELARVVAGAMEVDLEVQHLPPRHEVVDAWSDHSVVRAVFGHERPALPLRDGIGRMARWARSVGVHEPSALLEVEVARGLPESWTPRSRVT